MKFIIYTYANVFILPTFTYKLIQVYYIVFYTELHAKLYVQILCGKLCLVSKGGTDRITEFHKAMLLHFVCASYHNVGCHAQDHSLASLTLVHKTVVNFPAAVTAVVDSTDNIHRL